MLTSCGREELLNLTASGHYAPATPGSPAPSPHKMKQARPHLSGKNFQARDCDNSRHPSPNDKRPPTSRYPPIMSAVQSVQCFGKKKTATAVAHCKQGKGLIKVNGKPLSLVEPQVLRFKVYEPVLILGLDKFGRSSCIWRRRDGDWKEFG